MPPILAIANTLLTLRDSRPQDWPALRLLLPEAVHAGSPLHTLVAEDPAGRILAACALQPHLRPQPVPGMHVALHVVPPMRRQGLATALLHQTAAWAQPHGARALYAWGALEPGSTVETNWRRLGFTHSVWLEEATLSPARVLQHLDPLWHALTSRRTIPPGAAMTSLSPAHAPALLQLHLAHFGGNPARLRDLLSPESPTALDPAMCPVLLLHDQPIGYALTLRTGPASARVEGIVVHPAHRHRGWANLWLKREGMQRALSLGIHELTYFTHAEHRDTRRFTGKLATRTRALVEPYRPLA